MSGVAMPDESHLPPGPQRNLTLAIHALYLAAGKPGTRKISNAIRDREDLPDTVSHEAVRAILGGARSRWHKVESVVRQLASWSTKPVDVDDKVAEIHRRWLAVEGAEAMRPNPVAAESSALRQAIRGLHRPTGFDAIHWFLRTLLYVPLAGTQTFVVASTQTKGLWVCAFTSTDRLRAHQAATGLHWVGDWLEIIGTDLVRRVHELSIPAGILVDPTAAGSDSTETLPLPNHLVTELANTS